MKLEDVFPDCALCGTGREVVYKCENCGAPNCDWCMSQFGCCKNKIEPKQDKKQEQKNVKT